MTGIGVYKTYYTFVGEPNIEEEYPRTIYNERVNGDLFRNEIETVSINRHREICGLTIQKDHTHTHPVISPNKIKVRYYSKDLSNNLEKIKEEEFIPDITPPTINLFVNSKSYETGNYKLSNLSIRVDTCDFLNIVDCSLNISKLNDNFNIKYAFVNSNSERYKKEVSGLKDGIYKVEVRCSDPLKNINTEEIIKSLDSNFLINNQRPLFDIYGPNKEINISLNTSRPGECRYSESHVFYRDMENSFIDEGTYHHSNINTKSDSGVYIIYTACNISGISKNEIVENRDTDWIYYRVDGKAPIINVSISNPEISEYEKEITIKCNDSDYSNEWGLELGTGCREINYTINPCNLSPNPATINNTYQYPFTVTYNELLERFGPGFNACVYYKAIDNVGNIAIGSKEIKELSDITPPEIEEATLS